MKKKLIVSALLLSVVATGFGVSGTYAKYIGETSGTGTATAATFTVDVNEKDVVTEDTFELTIVREQATGSTLVADGKIAPGSTGYFDVVIDPTGTEVALNYTVSELLVSGIDNLAITDYQIGTGETPVFGNKTAVTDGTVTGSITLTNGQALTVANKTTVRVYWEWTGYTDAAGDEKDTANAGETLTATGTVTVEQKLN